MNRNLVDDMDQSTSYHDSAWTRRQFLQAAAATGSLTAIAARCNAADESKSKPRSVGTVVLNDDGHVFLTMSDDLNAADLRRYFESYCRSGVTTVAFCVGDMSWPTRYPSSVGNVYQGKISDLKQLRIQRNLANFEREQGGYFGATFRILRELGKTTLASFRMNDAHYTSPDDPNVSEFWKKHSKLALGSAYGYYGGCLNYEAEVVRNHFVERVVEFVALYPEIDGIELDAMRSPYFFPLGKGTEGAPLITAMLRRIKNSLDQQAKRMNRQPYLLTMNVPLTPKLALASGLGVTAWDAEQLVDCLSVGTYQAYMNHPIEHWKEALKHIPVFAYVNCSPQTGQYLGRDEYRAAACNAYGSGADGIYLFNFPCLFELEFQQPSLAAQVNPKLSDLRSLRQGDFSKTLQAFDEIVDPKRLRGKSKRFLFHYDQPTGYRHHTREQSVLKRSNKDGSLTADFRCHDELKDAHSITLKFKIENVMRDERFQPSLNGNSVPATKQLIKYAANGRDPRVHTVKLEPYLQYEISLDASQIRRVENHLELKPTMLIPDLANTIQLREIELIVKYDSTNNVN